jgi:hypothetical protein
MITTVTRNQFFTALAAANEMNAAYQGVSADANYSDWVEFNSAQRVEVGDPLYVAVQIGLGYTSDQMLTLFEAAVQVPL